MQQTSLIVATPAPSIMLVFTHIALSGPATPTSSASGTITTRPLQCAAYTTGERGPTSRHSHSSHCCAHVTWARCFAHGRMLWPVPLQQSCPADVPLPHHHVRVRLVAVARYLPCICRRRVIIRLGCNLVQATLCAAALHIACSKLQLSA